MYLFPLSGSDNDDVVSAVETDYESSSSSSSSDAHAQSTVFSFC